VCYRVLQCVAVSCVAVCCIGLLSDCTTRIPGASMWNGSLNDD